MVPVWRYKSRITMAVGAP